MVKRLAAAIGLVSIAAAVASAEPPAGAAACSGCHPASSRVASPVVRLNGLDQATIVQFVRQFLSGQRVATVMDRSAMCVIDDDIVAITALYSTQQWTFNAANS